jgi:hypothetical protein
MFERLGDDVADLAARVQRRDRVLEDHLHAGAQLAQLLALERGDLVPSKRDRRRWGGGAA